MSDKKEYTPREVAEILLERLKKNIENNKEIYQILEKAKNTAHEIESGCEPSSELSECPDSLSYKGESSEDPSMEDEPLQDKEEEEEEDKEEEEEEEEEEEYNFKKSESGMYTVEYKRLIKKEDRCWEGYEPTPGKEPYTKGSCRKEKAEEMDKCGDMEKDEGMSVEEAVAAIMGDKHGVNDVMDKVKPEMRSKVMSALRTKDAKKAEMCKGYMDKCGDMKVVKSESGMHTVEYKRLAKAKVDEGKSDEVKKKIRLKRNKDLKQKGVHLKEGDYTGDKERAEKKFWQRKEERKNIQKEKNKKLEGKSKEITEKQKRAGWGQHQKDYSLTTNPSQAQGIKQATGKDVQIDPEKRTYTGREGQSKINTNGISSTSLIPKSEYVYKNEKLYNFLKKGNYEK